MWRPIPHLLVLCELVIGSKTVMALGILRQVIVNATDMHRC